MRIALTAVMLMSVAALSACSTAPNTQGERMLLEEEAVMTMQRFKQSHPAVANAFQKTAVAWAVIPTVTKGAVGVGGARGRGVLFQDGAIVGYCDLRQASIGAQVGGETYSEIIFFEDQDMVKRFKDGALSLNAQAAAVIDRKGGTTKARYRDGLAVATFDSGGAMVDASIGGQGFSYRPKY